MQQSALPALALDTPTVRACQGAGEAQHTSAPAAHQLVCEAEADGVKVSERPLALDGKEGLSVTGEESLRCRPRRRDVIRRTVLLAGPDIGSSRFPGRTQEHSWAAW